MPQYVLDTNIYIEAHRRYYTNDLVPSFWNSLEQCAGDRRVVSIDRVKDELSKQDWLEDWAKAKCVNAFESTNDTAIISAFSDAMKWVASQTQFTAGAVNEFAQVADGWVMAYAKVHGRAVVTHEQLRPDAKKRVPLPNVCKEFNVPYVDTFTMLRDLGIKLA